MPDVDVVALGKNVRVAFAEPTAATPTRSQGSNPYATHSVDGSTSRSAARGVSSIMSSATDAAGHPGLSPSRRATTLCTPSAAIDRGRLEGAAVARGQRDRGRRPSRACTTSTPVTSSAPASTASDDEERVELDAPNHQRGRAFGLDDRRLAARALRDTAATPRCVAMRGSAAARYGKPTEDTRS